MAKTEFQNGTIVEPAWLNAVFLNGHKHDGADQDGHCDKIDLTNEVTGRLPQANIGDHRHDGTDISKIMPNEIEGRFAYSFSLSFRNFAGESNEKIVQIDTLIEPVNIDYNLVTLIFPQFIYAGTETNNILTTSTTSIAPAILEEFRPAHNICQPVYIYDNNLIVPGLISIDTAGIVSFSKLEVLESGLYNNQEFTSNAEKGWPPLAIRYPLEIHG